jgi:hypothetical protein
MNCTFKDSPFNQDISDWDIGKVECMINVFNNSKFNHNLYNWAKQRPDLSNELPQDLIKYLFYRRWIDYDDTTKDEEGTNRNNI